MTNQVIFHLAFPVANIPQTKAFYRDGLGCEVGRESPTSIILNLYGHQLVAHVSHEPKEAQHGIYPRHFGIVFTSEADWEELLERSQEKGLHFYQQPKHRFVGLATEHRTFFLVDPFHNLLEFKYYREIEAIFGHAELNQVGDAV
ncbi:glyoxalase [Oscillatoriales cyanobacterium USR001]|nr:glyoxalase [Oscillatoriales cyanobacterium USR001]